MGKKKANERGSGDHLGSRKEGGGGGGVGDAAAEAEQLAEEQKIARAVKSGGVRTTNAALQNRLNLLVELAKRMFRDQNARGRASRAFETDLTRSGEEWVDVDVLGGGARSSRGVFETSTGRRERRLQSFQESFVS